MIDMNKGVSIIKQNDFILSTETTKSDVLEQLSHHIESYTVTNSYSHISVCCNNGLNYEKTNRIIFCFTIEEKLLKLRIIPVYSFDVYKKEDTKRLKKICYKWLKDHGQKTNPEYYDWGRVLYYEDFEKTLSAGITFDFKCWENRSLFDHKFIMDYLI